MRNTNIGKNWDMVVIGGGITGAGILREAVRNGLKTILVEQNDFAWGTSSRSSKLVHGGLRYLKEGRVMLTRESVKERERLLKEAPGLVEPLDFMLPIYQDKGPGKWTMEVGLSVYDIIAGKWRHKFHNKDEIKKIEPLVDGKKLVGAFSFMDAGVDDARLVLRLINEASDAGGTAVNYTRAVDILRNNAGQVKGVVLEDIETHERVEITTGAVINATGVWAEKLHPSPEKGKHIRPLRGSHLIFPADLVPIKNAISFFNPIDKRPLFIIPWEGAVLAGTTDVDHGQDLSMEPHISKEEAHYIIDSMKLAFPSLKVSLSDCIASIAGVRPVLSEGKLDPSKESREHAVWIDKGLVTVTGGKLTTFRALAWDTLKAAKPFLGEAELTGRDQPVFMTVDITTADKAILSGEQAKRLYGRYGMVAKKIIHNSPASLLEEIPGTYTLWAELVHTASNEAIRHLDDLLLRRVRIGLLLEDGGKKYLNKIRQLCEPVLDWNADRWDDEISAYLSFWDKYYSIPR
jgi:glycerol-3-phosphate dehydrogenase